MNAFIVLWQSQVVRSFHRLSTLAFPLGYLVFESVFRFTVFGSQPLDPATRMLPFVIGASLAGIGVDSSSGALPLLLTAPLRRSTYVLSHWASAATVASLWSLLQLVVQIALLAHDGIGVLSPFSAAAERVLFCFGVSSVLTCLSTRLPGYTHLLVFGGLLYVGNLGLGASEPATLLRSLAEVMNDQMQPNVEVASALHSTPMALAPFAKWLTEVSVALLAAVALFRNREASYAAR